MRGAVARAGRLAAGAWDPLAAYRLAGLSKGMSVCLGAEGMTKP
ncbi:hypothetical protein [Corynebacterium amycolatum]